MTMQGVWARMKEELLYNRFNTIEMSVEELMIFIWRYFISYCNNRRICSANCGLPPMVKRRRYYESLNHIYGTDYVYLVCCQIYYLTHSNHYNMDCFFENYNFQTHNISTVKSLPLNKFFPLHLPLSNYNFQ